MKTILRNSFLIYRSAKTFRTQGFTLTEVIVALLVMFIGGFTLLSSMVYSTGMSVKSQQQSYGLKWIQEDLEQVKVAAANWTFGTITNTAGALQLSGCASANCGLVMNDRIRLKDDSILHSVSSITGISVTLDPTLTLPSGNSIAFVPIKQCMATTINNGLATEFGAALSTLAPVPTTNHIWKGSTYSLTRGGYNSSATPSVKNVAPFNILEIAYRVAPVSGPGKTFVVSTEVLPNAVLQCP
jgi:type II secretory pathway pseudopilin PulG